MLTKRLAAWGGLPLRVSRGTIDLGRSPGIAQLPVGDGAISPRPAA
jgi:hypothetical protein